MPRMGTARHLPLEERRVRDGCATRLPNNELYRDAKSRCTANDAAQGDLYARRNATRAERAKRATQVGLPRHTVGVKPAPIRPNVAVGELA